MSVDTRTKKPAAGPKNLKSDGTKSDSGWDLAVIVMQAVLIAIVVRIFLFQPFNIPSGSMKRTLLVGDYLFVSKYSYGYSHFSLPFDGFNLFSGRILESEPKRGDIAVFRKPSDTSEDYIKRVIGLPGDVIQMREGVLYINGTAVPKRPTGELFSDSEEGPKIPVFEEELPNGVKYKVLDRDPNGPEDNTGEFRVPPHHYFMMGDNRDNSQDSRFLSQVGYVPIENFIGRAEVIFYSIDDKGDWVWWQPWTWRPWAWFTETRFGRIFQLTR